jgi:hypothetical protein
MKILIHSFAAIFLFSACSTTRPVLKQEMATRAEPSSVLFIGNSYSFDVPKELGRIAAREGRKLRIKQITLGGWTLAQHVASGEAAREIRKGKWDVVVIQEQSRIPSLPSKRVREMIPNVRKLADEAHAAGALPVLYQTWGRRDGDTYLVSRDDFHSMNKRLREGYQQAAHAAGGLTVVPVGEAWEREVDAGRGDSLFMPDGSHPTDRAEALTAEVFFKTLFLSEKAHQPLQDGQ